MREIKFRGYNTKTKQMLYSKDAPPNTQEHQLSDFFVGCTIFHDFKNVGEQLHIMQFTGLLDEYGKAIYEGDILRKTTHPRMDFIVSFSDGKFNISDYRTSNLKIIGNIYENPELLLLP